MRSLLLALLFWAPLPARAEQAESGSVGAQFYLVQDKFIAGVSGGVQGPILGLDAEFSLLFTREEDTSGATDGSFIGGLLGAHLMARVPLDLGPVMLRGGTGLDAFGLWGINSEEWKYAWPLLAEGRARVFARLEVFVRARWYLLNSDGLGVGEHFDGEQGPPFLMSVGVGGRWE